MKQIKRQAATVLAMYLGWDIKELKDCVYQPYHTTKPVYTIGDDYYCIVRQGQQPAIANNSDRQWKWEEKKDSFIEGQGCTLYISKCESE